MFEKASDIILVVGRVLRIPSPGLRLRVKEQDIVNSTVLFATLLGVAVRGAPFPRDFGFEILRMKDGIHEELEVWLAVGSQWR